MKKPRGTPEQRFWRHVDMTLGCWPWTGALNHAGYGRLRLPTTHQMAHRFAYELLVGPIPDGLTIDHLCKNRRCVNPQHLEPVSRGENSRRGTRHTNGYDLRTHCPAGHPYSPENTYIYKGGRACRTCRRETDRRYKQRSAA